MLNACIEFVLLVFPSILFRKQSKYNFSSAYIFIDMIKNEFCSYAKL